MDDWLTMSRSLDRLLPGELKVLDAFFRIAAATVMVCKIREVFVELSFKEPLDGLCHVLVQLLAAFEQNGAVRHFLRQCVLEAVLGVREGRLLNYELAPLQIGQDPFKLALSAPCHPPD